MKFPLPKPKKRKKKKRAGMDPKHLEFIRRLPCCICGYEPVEAHHLKFGTGERGMGMRSTDKWAVPLCHEHHINGVERFGSKMEASWFKAKGVNPLNLAKDLWGATGDIEAMWKIINDQNL